MKLKKKNRKAKAYILYRFPSLHIFADGRRVSRILAVSAMVLLVCASIGYAVWGRTFTRNGVFDSVIATPIQTALIVAVVGFFSWLRVLAYRKTSGIRGGEAPVSPGLTFAFHDYPFRKVIFDCGEVSSIKTMHPFVTAVLRFTIFDKEDLFRLEAGSLDVPKAALESVSIIDGDMVIKLSSTSFYDIFYTHYFADYTLSMQHIDENAENTRISLRSLFEEKAIDFIRHGIEGFSEQLQIMPFPVLPNPLGTTGICRVKAAGAYVYILRKRKGDLVNELHTHDWSFSGLVEAHTLMFPGDVSRTEFDYISNELNDELFSQIGCCTLRTGEITPLGIVFSSKYLCQPEFVALVDIVPSDEMDGERLGTYMREHAHGDFSFVSEEYLRSLLARGEFKGYKDIFPDITRLLLAWLDRGAPIRGDGSRASG